MTAEDFLKGKFREIYKKQPESFTSKITESRYLDLHVTGRIDGVEQNYPEMMIEFAKYHVEKALKQASKKVNRKEGFITDYKLTESILNVYPTNLIK